MVVSTAVGTACPKDSAWSPSTRLRDGDDQAHLLKKVGSGQLTLCIIFAGMAIFVISKTTYDDAVCGHLIWSPQIIKYFTLDSAVPVCTPQDRFKVDTGFASRAHPTGYTTFGSS
jgi:hypothetical protein